MALPAVRWLPSPNYNQGRGGHAIRAEVKHRIVGSLQSAINVFASPARQASTHFGIGTLNGALAVCQFVDLSDMAWGNGDVRDPSWIRIIPGVNPNLYTVSTEHEDGGASNGGVVSEAIWQASMELSRLLRSGNLSAVRGAGIHVREPISLAQLAAMPIDTGSYIDHNQIAGPNKPYCFRRWLDDPGFVEGAPSRRDRLLSYLKSGGDALPALKPVRQQWTTGTGDTLAPDALATTKPGGQFWTMGPNQGAQKFFTAPEKVTSIAESADGDWRVIEYGAEILWMHRHNLRPVDGTRNPPTGFGSPKLSTGGGFSQADLDTAKAAGVKAGISTGFLDAKTKARLAVEAIK